MPVQSSAAPQRTSHARATASERLPQTPGNLCRPQRHRTVSGFAPNDARYADIQSQPAATRIPSRPAAHAGFTLIELLMVIALIAVLVSLTLPGLRGSRESAVRATGLAYLRSHVAIMAQYSSDYKDSFPYFTDPTATTTVIRTARGDVVSLEYFAAFAYWNYALADGYYNGDPNDRSFYPGQSIAGGATTLSYGCCFIADPGFWNPRSRIGTAQLHATRLTSVRYPSKKALLSWFDTRLFEIPNDLIDPSWQTLPVGLGMVDGSAQSIPLHKVVYGYQSGDGSILLSPHLSDYPPALHTIDGIYGRDVP
jgi:prepilin-type N-terminal cleavage/methylation domain-containing protein